jgi:phage terminase small subunit
MGDVAKRPHSGLYVRAARGLQFRDERVRRMLRKLRAAAPRLEPSDLMIARRFCEIEVSISQVYAAMRTQGVLTPDGEARSLVDIHRRLAQTQAMLARELGLSPAARLAIKASGTKAALDLVAAMATDAEAAPAETPANRSDNEKS